MFGGRVERSLLDMFTVTKTPQVPPPPLSLLPPLVVSSLILLATEITSPHPHHPLHSPIMITTATTPFSSSHRHRTFSDMSTPTSCPSSSCHCHSHSSEERGGDLNDLHYLPDSHNSVLVDSCQHQESPLKSLKSHHHRSSNSFTASNTSEFDSTPGGAVQIGSDEGEEGEEDVMPLVRYDPCVDQFSFSEGLEKGYPAPSSSAAACGASASSCFASCCNTRPRYLHSLQVEMPSISPLSLRDNRDLRKLSPPPPARVTHHQQQQGEGTEEEEGDAAFGLFQFPQDDQDQDHFLLGLELRDYEEV
jgi:hypothetical protein